VNPVRFTPFFSLGFFLFLLFQERVNGVVQSRDGFGGAVLLYVFQFPNDFFGGHNAHTPFFGNLIVPQYDSGRK
jgi:hypothetical protein